jgi:hypothetical protein
VTRAGIAIAAMQDKGLDPESDPVTLTDFVRRITLQLNDLVRNGKIEKIGARAHDAMEADRKLARNILYLLRTVVRSGGSYGST